MIRSVPRVLSQDRHEVWQLSRHVLCVVMLHLGLLAVYNRQHCVVGMSVVVQRVHLTPALWGIREFMSSFANPLHFIC